MSAKFPNTYLGYQCAFSTENRVSGLKRPRSVQLVCKVLRCPPRSDNRRLHALLSFLGKGKTNTLRSGMRCCTGPVVPMRRKRTTIPAYYPTAPGTKSSGKRNSSMQGKGAAVPLRNSYSITTCVQPWMSSSIPYWMLISF